MKEDRVRSRSMVHLQRAVILLTAVIAAGTVGFILIEHWGFIDSLYMTIISISTVGFGEVHKLSQAGRVFTIFLIAAGVSAAGYTLGSIVEFMVEGYFTDIWGGRMMERRIAALRDHYIICGFGRVGEQIAREFKRAKAPFVVLDSNPDVKQYLDAEEVLYIQGNASDDAVLKEAGIDRAKGLVTVVDGDEDNVYVTLSARVLNPNLFIIARANLEGSEEKLKRAGANRVVSPYSLGGRRIASMVLQPAVDDFLDSVMHGERLEFRLMEVDVGPNSILHDQTIKDANIRQRCGVTILSIRRPDGHFESDIHKTTKIKTGDKLVVIGTNEQLAKLQELL